MKRERLSEALNEISDAHIAEAATSKRRMRPVWFGAVAAVLALAVFVGVLTRPTPASAAALLAAPEYPEMVHFTGENWEEWGQSQSSQYDQPKDYAHGTEAFFKESITTFLQPGAQNQAYSPLNVYMALAMLAETAGGESRQQLLTLLGADSIEALRTQAGHMWNAHYCDDGLATSVLANSLWLDEAYPYQEDTVNTLADSYYASVYRGELSSEEMNEALRDWLNEQTGDLLKEQAEELEMSQDTLLALASTIYYNVQWSENFREENNTDGIFHTPDGDVDVTYMNRTLSAGPYYWGEDFGAVSLSLRDGSRMWLILPDEGYTPADLLRSGHVLNMVLNYDYRSYDDRTYLRVNLSLPKFDVVSDIELKDGLQELGITHVFDPEQADLSSLIPPTDESVYVSQASHAVRVAVDEEGVLAAAYTVIIADAAAAEPPEEEMDFILDRPFLFLIESQDGIPLFTGIVNTP